MLALSNLKLTCISNLGTTYTKILTDDGWDYIKFGKSAKYEPIISPDIIHLRRLLVKAKPLKASLRKTKINPSFRLIMLSKEIKKV